MMQFFLPTTISNTSFWHRPSPKVLWSISISAITLWWSQCFGPSLYSTCFCQVKMFTLWVMWWSWSSQSCCGIHPWPLLLWQRVNSHFQMIDHGTRTWFRGMFNWLGFTRCWSMMCGVLHDSINLFFLYMIIRLLMRVIKFADCAAATICIRIQNFTVLP